MTYGYLGAGKTTFARRLERELPAIRFSNDDWVTHLFSDNPPLETFQQNVDRVGVLVDQCWMRCARLGLDIVLDSGFWSRESRDNARENAAAVGADHRLYHLHVPEDVAWERVRKRNFDLNGSFLIERSTFELLKVKFEPLGADEAHVVVEAR